MEIREWYDHGDLIIDVEDETTGELMFSQFLPRGFEERCARDVEAEANAMLLWVKHVRERTTI